MHGASDYFGAGVGAGAGAAGTGVGAPVDAGAPMGAGAGAGAGGTLLPVPGSDAGFCAASSSSVRGVSVLGRVAR